MKVARSISVCLLGTVLLPLAACDTFVVLRLQPDSALGDEAALARSLRQLEIMLDAEDGFAALDDSQGAVGASAEDLDGDGALELVYRLDIEAGEQLPRVRLDPGHNAGREIRLQLRGLDADGALIGYGGLPAQRLFADGGGRELSVPFNPSPRQRAPRLLAVTPRSVPVGFVLDGIGLLVSRPLDPASLEGRIHLSVRIGNGTEQVLSHQLEGPRACAGSQELWVVRATGCRAPAAGVKAVMLGIDEGVQDTQGRALQLPDGQSTASFSVEVELEGFGSCTTSLSCLRHGREGGLANLDLRCDPGSGRFEPAPCSVTPGGCLAPGTALGWVRADSTTACQAMREYSSSSEGFCSLGDAWPCADSSDCGALASSCDAVAGQCEPPPCDGSCADDSLLCVGTSCLARLGTCMEDCEVYGGCPSFAQTCVSTEAGARVCQ